MSQTIDPVEAPCCEDGVKRDCDLNGMKFRNLEIVQRCNECCIYPNDLQAAKAVSKKSYWIEHWKHGWIAVVGERNVRLQEYRPSKR